MSKFYAINEGIENEIAAFNSEHDRDEWVNYNDPFSREFRATAENTGFARVAISAEAAEKIISDVTYIEPDMFNDNQEWYLECHDDVLVETGFVKQRRAEIREEMLMAG